MHALAKTIVGSLSLALGSTAGTANAGAAQRLQLSYTDTALGGYTMPYNLFLPADYDPAGPALPVILFLHGAGERGTDNTSHINLYVQPLIDATQGATGSHRAIVIAPQIPYGQVWNSINAGDRWYPGGSQTSSYAETPAQQAARPISNALQAAMDLLTHVQTTQKVDSQRTYITGLSMGGFGTWDAITRFPERFAAAMPLSGGGNRLAGSILASEPVWAYHGADDPLVFSNGSTDVINAIRNSGGTQSIYTLVPGITHYGWDMFYTPYPSSTYTTWYVGGPSTTGGIPDYSGDNVYDWLFAQTSVPEPGSVTILAGVAAFATLTRRHSTARRRACLRDAR